MYLLVHYGFKRKISNFNLNEILTYFSCDFDDCNMASTKAVPLLTSGHQVHKKNWKDSLVYIRLPIMMVIAHAVQALPQTQGSGVGKLSSSFFTPILFIVASCLFKEML